MSRDDTIASLAINSWINGGRVDWPGADLRWADLTECDLTGADLGWANLREADLRGADLTGCDLFDADLTECDMRRAKVTFGGRTFTLTEETAR
jgi:uncharacterized protein YjbI with pentapeptide repeats